MTREDSYWTPLPPLRFAQPGEAGDGAPQREVPRPRRRTPTRVLAAAFAFLSVGGLAAGVIVPLAPTAGEAADESVLAAPQSLTGSLAPEEAFDAFRGGEVADLLATSTGSTAGPDPETGLWPETGLLDPGLLQNSAVRYPFDRTMPLTDGFGPRTVPVSGFHDAQDFAAPEGSQVRVIASGIVLEAGWAADGCGFSLKVQHKVDDETLTSRYCHMQPGSHSYEKGDTVTIGDVAGRVGNTGMSFGAHLHLALRLEGEPIDPLPYIAAKSA